MLPRFLKHLTVLFDFMKIAENELENMNPEIKLKSTAEEKAEFRKMMKERLREYEKDFLTMQKNAESAFKSFTQSELYKDSRTILAFMSSDFELDTHAVVKKALQDGKSVAIPRIISEGEMDFCYLSAQKSLESQLEKNAYNILEPKTDLEKLDAEHLPVHTVLLVPGLAFSRSGARLGRGKGYYDRYIEKLYAQKSVIHLPTAIIGWGAELQVFDEIPIDDHDAMVTHIVTEKGIFLCE